MSGYQVEDLVREARERRRYASSREEALDFIRTLITRCAPELEEARSAHAATGEVLLTRILVGPLRALRLFDVSTEPDGNGNVDIELSDSSGIAVPALRGEAKIVTSSQFTYYVDGLGKLLERFNSGRSFSKLGLMVAYCKDSDTFSVMRDFLHRIVANKACKFVAEVDVALFEGLSEIQVRDTLFVTQHSSGGNTLDVVHMWINMDPRDEGTLVADLRAARGAKVRVRKPKVP